jgi:hypothetical protein
MQSLILFEFTASAFRPQQFPEIEPPASAGRRCPFDLTPKSPLADRGPICDKLDAIVFRMRSGCQWNKLPERYGSDSTAHRPSAPHWQVQAANPEPLLVRLPARCIIKVIPWRRAKKQRPR